MAAFICVSVFAGEQCICISAMVHEHNESPGYLADRPYGPAVACISAENPHQNCKGKTTASLSTNVCIGGHVN